MTPSEKHRKYWHRNLRLTGALLFVWFVVTFVASFYARELNAIVFFGFPFGFYMGAQGALLVYVAIIGYYAHRMNKLDAEFGPDETGRASTETPSSFADQLKLH